MRANELRIGNWVEFRPSNYKKYNNQRAVMVKEIDRNGILADDKGIDLGLRFDNDGLRPIELTPEILEACGFEKEDLGNDGVIWFKKSVQFRYPTSGHPHFMHYGYVLNPRLCYYLHQLQNLYFALTGEELQYKPSSEQNAEVSDTTEDDSSTDAGNK